MRALRESIIPRVPSQNRGPSRRLQWMEELQALFYRARTIPVGPLKSLVNVQKENSYNEKLSHIFLYKEQKSFTDLQMCSVNRGTLNGS